MSERTKAEMFAGINDTPGASGSHIQKDEAFVDDHIETRDRVGAIEATLSSGDVENFTPGDASPLSQVGEKMDRHTFLPHTWTNINDNGDPDANPVVAPAPVVHEAFGNKMGSTFEDDGSVLHFGGDYEAKANEQMNLVLSLAMKTAETNKNKKFTVAVFDANTGAQIGSDAMFDDLSVPGDTARTDVTLLSVLPATAITTPTPVRFQVKGEGASADSHSGSAHVSKLKVTYGS